MGRSFAWVQRLITKCQWQVLRFLIVFARQAMDRWGVPKVSLQPSLWTGGKRVHTGEKVADQGSHVARVRYVRIVRADQITY